MGLVAAPDGVKAIEVAIRAFHLTESEHQKNLVAEARD
jgi:hypothetical protein